MPHAAEPESALRELTQTTNCATCDANSSTSLRESDSGLAANVRLLQDGVPRPVFAGSHAVREMIAWLAVKPNSHLSLQITTMGRFDVVIEVDGIVRRSIIAMGSKKRRNHGFFAAQTEIVDFILCSTGKQIISTANLLVSRVKSENIPISEDRTCLTKVGSINVYFFAPGATQEKGSTGFPGFPLPDFQTTRKWEHVPASGHDNMLVAPDLRITPDIYAALSKEELVADPAANITINRALPWGLIRLFYRTQQALDRVTRLDLMSGPLRFDREQTAAEEGASSPIGEPEVIDLDKEDGSGEDSAIFIND